MFKNQNGFTLIELLVVMSIIALLSAVILTSVNSAREKARGARMVRDFQTIESALRLMGDQQGITRWWDDTAICGLTGGNPDISLLISTANCLSPFLTRAPVPPNGLTYGYDYDVGTPLICGSGNVYDGVNIHARGVDGALATIVNKMVDGDNNLSCGKIRYDGSAVPGSLFYLLGTTNTDY